MSNWENIDNQSTWRPISVGMWSAPRDPTVYELETVEAERARRSNLQWISTLPYSPVTAYLTSQT